MNIETSLVSLLKLMRVSGIPGGSLQALDGGTIFYPRCIGQVPLAPFGDLVREMSQMNLEDIGRVATRMASLPEPFDPRQKRAFMIDSNAAGGRCRMQWLGAIPHIPYMLAIKILGVENTELDAGILDENLAVVV